MWAHISGRVVALGLAVTLASCSDKGAETGTAAPGGGGGSAGASSPAGGAGGSNLNGGAAGSNASAGSGGAVATAQPTTRIRFLQGYQRQGVKAAWDIGARDRSGTWLPLAQNLAFGTLTDYIDVPIGDGLNTFLWFLPPGSDPKTFTIDDNAIDLPIYPDDTGPHTAFFSFTDDVTQFSLQLLSDADPTLTLTAGYAYVLFDTNAIRGAYPTLDYGSESSCIKREMQDYYQPVNVGTAVFSLHDGNGSADCQGKLVASSPSITLADQDVWALFALGDPSFGLELRPVQLKRH